MKVSLNWLKEFTAIDLPVDQLVERIGLQLGAVEEVVDLSKKYQGILVVKVVKSQKHPNADKLSLCLVDDGGAEKTAKRNSDGLIQVVCGAPNVKAGMLAAWIPPGATVPATYDKEPFVIEARPIRNKTSHGMLASPKELDLGEGHEGILALEGGQPGGSLAKTLWLDDYVIDIENKMFTHRPDCFGVLGVAREIAGIQAKPFKSPDWYRRDAGLPADGRKNVLEIKVENSVPKLVPRFLAVAVKDIKVADSPAWLQSFLARTGVRPVNNIVDITNFVMLETGQPLHAYDYDKVAELAEQKAKSNKQKVVTIGIRLSKKGESLKLLGGKAIKLDAGSIVITDGKQPIGLGGVMGGAGTEVDENTKNIVLECANFDMNATRRSAMRYGLFTDAATRFTKNQSPLQNPAAAARALSLINQIAGGRQASPLIDDNHAAKKQAPVMVSGAFINSRLGLEITAAGSAKLLENVEFSVKRAGDKLTVTPPFWRTDIHIAEDIVEEVGRLYGYDKLPAALPRRDAAPAPLDPLLGFKARLRGILRRAGANEALTYSFVHGSLIGKAGQDSKNAFHIRNAVSPDLQYYRLSLTPSLLEKVHPNIKAGYGQFALFELGKAHGKSEIEDGIPKEFERLSIVSAGKTAGQGAAFYQAKTYVGFLAKELNLDLRYEPFGAGKFKDHKLFQQMIAVYEPERAALIFAGEKLAGAIGEFQAATKKGLKLPDYCAGAELFLSALQGSAQNYQPLNRYPELEQDFCLRSSGSRSYQELTDFMNTGLSRLSDKPGYHFRIEPLDIFQKKGDTTHKQTTWRIILWHPERTLTTPETNKLLDELAAKAKKELKAERV